METTKAYGEGGTAPRIISLVIRGYVWSTSRSGRFTTDDSDIRGYVWSTSRSGRFTTDDSDSDPYIP